MIRQPGRYAVIAGIEHYVQAATADYVKIAGPHGPIQHSMDSLEDLLSVKLQATWRGGRIAISHVDQTDTVGFYTNDGKLAERENLGGDFYNGWWGGARIDELTEVTERESSIHPRNRPRKQTS